MISKNCLLLFAFSSILGNRPETIFSAFFAEICMINNCCQIQYVIINMNHLLRLGVLFDLDWSHPGVATNPGVHIDPADPSPGYSARQSLHPSGNPILLQDHSESTIGIKSASRQLFTAKAEDAQAIEGARGISWTTLLKCR